MSCWDGRVVGEEGRISQRAAVPTLGGEWAQSFDSVNELIENLVRPTSEMARVIGAVAGGDLSQTMATEIDGRPMKGQFLQTAKTVNTMVHQLNGFSDLKDDGSTACGCWIYSGVYPDAEKNLAWVRAFYRDLFAESGGVPVPGDAYDGTFINHPDTDFADPTLNTSGVPWHKLYYKENYPRLQRIKARWDPRNVFRHALSIRGG